MQSRPRVQPDRRPHVSTRTGKCRVQPKEKAVQPHGFHPAEKASSTPAPLRRVLAVMSIVTMLLTVPQVLTIWLGHQAAGVSVISWSAYLASAALWFWHGLLQRDRNIWLPCVGWIALDIAIIAGALVYS